jgi:two-component system LytT family response regulator
MQRLFDSYERKETSTITAFNIIEKGLEICVQAEAIEYLIADSEYVAIHSRSRKYLKRLTLELLAKQLPQPFIRIHRSIIINRNLLRSWKYLNNGTYSFHFSNDVTLKSSRSYQQAVQAMLSPNDI